MRLNTSHCSIIFHHSHHTLPLSTHFNITHTALLSLSTPSSALFRTNHTLYHCHHSHHASVHHSHRTLIPLTALMHSTTPPQCSLSLFHLYTLGKTTRWMGCFTTANPVRAAGQPLQINGNWPNGRVHERESASAH